ncbi:hypothetical protein ACWGB8_02165 [Kitasatospora sp. NPDC054939]
MQTPTPPPEPPHLHTAAETRLRMARAQLDEVRHADLVAETPVAMMLMIDRLAGTVEGLIDLTEGLLAEAHRQDG